MEEGHQGGRRRLREPWSSLSTWPGIAVGLEPWKGDRSRGPAGFSLGLWCPHAPPTPPDRTFGEPTARYQPLCGTDGRGSGEHTVHVPFSTGHHVRGASRSPSGDTSEVASCLHYAFLMEIPGCLPIIKKPDYVPEWVHCLQILSSSPHHPGNTHFPLILCFLNTIPTRAVIQHRE